jgi:hypothetical protein
LRKQHHLEHADGGSFNSAMSSASRSSARSLSDDLGVENQRFTLRGEQSLSAASFAMACVAS